MNLTIINRHKVDYKIYKRIILYTWIKWYKITRDNYDKLEERQDQIFDFFHKKLECCVEKVRILFRCYSQKYALVINGLAHSDSDIDHNVSNFRFKFYSLDLEFEKPYGRCWDNSKIG